MSADYQHPLLLAIFWSQASLEHVPILFFELLESLSFLTLAAAEVGIPKEFTEVLRPHPNSSTYTKEAGCLQDNS
jgi:hypothetical protein